MVCVTYARVLDVDIEGFILKDLLSGTEIRSKARGEAAFEIKKDDEGLFRGLLLPNMVFEVQRMDKRKMLTPLYEKDLFGASGRFTMVEPINDPFTKYFKMYEGEEYIDTHARELAEAEPESLPNGTSEIVRAEDTGDEEDEG